MFQNGHSHEPRACGSLGAFRRRFASHVEWEEEEEEGGVGVPCLCAREIICQKISRLSLMRAQYRGQ